VSPPFSMVFNMPIPLNPAGCSDPKRPLVPIETGHLSIGAKRRWG
jgi:hypothetical protein